MANRILIGNRSTGGYGLYVSEPSANVLDCGQGDLTFWTDSGETGSSFISKGIHQTVPWSGGTSSTAPTVVNNITISAGSTASLTYVDLGANPFILGGFAQTSASGSNNNVKYVKFTSTDENSSTGNAPGIAGTFSGAIFKTLGGGATDY